MHRRPLSAVVVLLSAALHAGQGTKQGSPEESLPPNIVRLTHFGERASWSPDGRRIAFMEKSFGDAYEVDVTTRVIRLLTHYAHPGFLRVQFMPNGDYFLKGIFPDGEYTLVESSREQREQNSNFIDIWKLKLEPNSQNFTRVTRWGEYAGYKASNPVVSPDGRRMAFQSARSKDPAGVGYGIFVMTLK